jgi:hypothetical protein
VVSTWTYECRRLWRIGYRGRGFGGPARYPQSRVLLVNHSKLPRLQWEQHREYHPIGGNPDPDRR